MLRLLLFLWTLCPVLVTLAQTPIVPQDIGGTNALASWAGTYNSPTNGLGSWIWAATVSDNQTVRFWKSFEIPASAHVKQARLCMTADNAFVLYLDGRELGKGVEWRELFIFDLPQLLTPGRHILAVRAFNSSFYGGMILGLRIQLADGRRLEIKSDASWRIVPNGVTDWQKATEAPAAWPAATLEGPWGVAPWGGSPENINIMPVLKPIHLFFWQTGWFQITLLSVCGIVIAISLRLVAQLALHRKERRLLLQERARIARDIHDDLGSRMTQLVLHGEVAQSELPNESDTRSQIDLICQDARGVLHTLDEILWAVNPRRDTLRDFASYVCNYAEQFLRSTHIQCFLDVDPELPEQDLNLPIRSSLLLAIKETINNAVKHSEATEFRLHIHCEREQLLVEVKDNGKGFEPTTAETRRNGLRNMAQRMMELGGSCVVISRPGQGCTIRFVVPLKHPRWWLWNSNWKQAEAPARPGQTSKDDSTSHSSHFHEPSRN